MRYSLLNHGIDVENQAMQYIPRIFEKFEIEAECISPSVTINVKKKESAGYGIETILVNTRNMYNLFFSEKDHSQVLCSLVQDYSEFLLSTRETCSDDVFMELFMTAFYSYISLHDALLMHASAVSYENKSIVFTAPSGTGKTTQAELWAKYKGATILNGDKVFLKREADGIHAWGSPWKGSSPYAENASAPLRTIVALEQAEENSIRKLEGFEVLEYVVPHVFFPSWDERCEQAVLTFLDQVLGETEVYLLKCRPDEGAVELLASTIKE